MRELSGIRRIVEPFSVTIITYIYRWHGQKETMHHDAHSVILDEPTLTNALDAMVDRVETTLDQLDDEFPLVADLDTGEWETTQDGNWCAGNWIGLLWIAAEHVDDPDRAECLASAAREYTDTMREDSTIHETMWGGMNYLYAGFRAYDITGDRDLFGVGLEGADAMLDEYHDHARQVPIGEYTVAGPSHEFSFGPDTDENPSGDRVGSSDSIYTAIPVLWRAYHETGNERFRDTAISHADRHQEWHVREDGSTWNRTVFDPDSGKVVRHHNALAYSDDTCWARGQGWNVAGYARAYNETHAERYLEVLERLMKYYVENSPEDLVPYWDFESPEIPDTPKDTSAAGLTAYGLVRLDGEDERVESLRETGSHILASLLEEYVPTEGNQRGMVLHGCYTKPSGYAVDNDLIWTDYYVAYTLYELLHGTGNDANT